MIDADACRRQIKEGKLARLYVVCGGEDYLKQHYVNRLCETAVEPDFRDFNFHRFEGKEIDLDTLSQAVEAVPLLGERTCVLVRDFALDGANADDALFAFFRNLPAHVVLVFWMDTVDFYPKKAKKVLLEAVNADGHMVDCVKPEAAQTLRLVLAGLKARGCTMDQSTAKYFIEAVGSDLNGLQNEMEKLCAFAGGGAVTREQVDAVCVKTVDARTFDMVNHVVAGNGAAALRLLDELFRQKVAPQMLLGSLAANFVDLFRAGAAQQSGRRAEEPAKLFDYKGKAFRLQNAGRMVSKLGMPRILRCLDLLDQADRRLKSGGIDNRLAMELCVCALLDARQ
ncbi:MAG: DNA polymerase III subunit delta [Oscillospiraceae bacterium]|nr:DNA polymerase III subunit delta [Oscillospiraceae bacterium]